MEWCSLETDHYQVHIFLVKITLYSKGIGRHKQYYREVQWIKQRKYKYWLPCTHRDQYIPRHKVSYEQQVWLFQWKVSLSTTRTASLIAPWWKAAVAQRRSKGYKWYDHMPIQALWRSYLRLFHRCTPSFHRSDQFFGFTRQYANKQCTVPLRYKRR